MPIGAAGAGRLTTYVEHAVELLRHLRRLANFNARDTEAENTVELLLGAELSPRPSRAFRFEPYFIKFDGIREVNAADHLKSSKRAMPVGNRILPGWTGQKGPSIL